MTYLYSLIGNWLFPIIFATELVEAVLHGSSMINIIPMGRKFNSGLVRFQFVVEAISIWCCFWHLEYGTSLYGIIYYTMAFHFIFHMFSNFTTVVFVLDDFSKPFEGGKAEAAKWIVRWDFLCHCYNVYCLSNLIGSLNTIIFSVLVLGFLIVFPKNLIYSTKNKTLKISE